MRFGRFGPARFALGLPGLQQPRASDAEGEISGLGRQRQQLEEQA